MGLKVLAEAIMLTQLHLLLLLLLLRMQMRMPLSTPELLLAEA